jgi:hypothetical protein
VQLVPTCAVVSPSEATTGADGTIVASVTPQPGCPSVSIDVVARAAADTAVLARQTVVASTGANNVRLVFRIGAGGFDFGTAPDVRIVPPLRRYQTDVELVGDDGGLHGCGVGNQPCAAHWSASGGQMIDGRPDGTAVGSVGTFTAGPDFGRFSITATSLANEFPATTNVLVVAPVGTFSVHACEWQVTQEESDAQCFDTKVGDSPTSVVPRDGDGVRLGVSGPLFGITGMLTFDMAGNVPTRFKNIFICNGLPECGVEVDPSTRGFEVAEASADAEHLTILLRFLQKNDPTATLRWRRATLTRTVPPLP